MSELLTLSNVSVELQQKLIVNRASFTLNKGDILGLVGPSGCGKTTLLNTLAGFIELCDGEIKIIPDLVVNSSNLVAAEDRNIGMIFQDYALFPHLNVAQNIAFGLSELPKAQQKERTQMLLSLLALADYEDRYPHQLSGGQQQRVAIARALAPQPRLLLLDEPFSNIDSRLKHGLMKELRQLLKSLEITAIFVTHNKDEVFSFADKMAVMNQGEILQVAEPNKVYQHPVNWQVADFLQIGNWFPMFFDGETYFTALGKLDVDATKLSNNLKYQLLVRSQDLLLATTETPNVEVVDVNVNEFGYHYQLQSLDQGAILSVSDISFYHKEYFAQGSKLALAIGKHEYQIFNATL